MKRTYIIGFGVAGCLLVMGCRYNGNQFVTIQAPAGEKGLAPIGDGLAASGAINVIQSGNSNSQAAGKTLDGLKGAANIPVNGSQAEGSPSVSTPQPEPVSGPESDK